ncbi:hypothetical protein [Desulfonauticus submarinus]
MEAKKISQFPSKDQETQHFAQEIIAKTQKDMGKVALIISILAVLLVAILFFGLNQNVKGLSTQIHHLENLPKQITTLGSKVNLLEDKVYALENLPQRTKNLIIANTLQEMASKTKYLSTQVQNENQAVKLVQIQQLLKQLQAEIGSAK